MLTLRPYQEKIVNTLNYCVKNNEKRVLVNASVGSGKSLIIAEFINAQSNKKILCLTLNSTLIKQNHKAYKHQGGSASIYSASLNQKNYKEKVVFASPFSVVNGIEKQDGIDKVQFDIIIVDEAHNVNNDNPNTTYMKIFDFYNEKSKGELLVVGLTGTPFRGKGHPIVGDDKFFKKQVAQIDSDWLIKKKFLVKPCWGLIANNLHYNFISLDVKENGWFDSNEIKEKIGEKPRLTQLIMQEVQNVMTTRSGAIIFASTIEHAKECLYHLPVEESEIITGQTSSHNREYIINKAKKGELKYIVNVNVLATGVDIPRFDTIVMVRPTESLVLYTQCIGRGMRLFKGKNECLILDYAQNLERHGEIGNGYFKNAYNKLLKTNPENFTTCLKCKQINPVGTRRCKNYIGKSRCDYRFIYTECPACECEIDITCRNCPKCNYELIDPNEKLTLTASYKKENLRTCKALYSYSFIREDGLTVGFLIDAMKFIDRAYHKGIELEQRLRFCIDKTYPTIKDAYDDFPELKRYKSLPRKPIEDILYFTPKQIVVDKNKLNPFEILPPRIPYKQLENIEISFSELKDFEKTSFQLYGSYDLQEVPIEFASVGGNFAFLIIGGTIYKSKLRIIKFIAYSNDAFLLKKLAYQDPKVVINTFTVTKNENNDGFIIGRAICGENIRDHECFVYNKFSNEKESSVIWEDPKYVFVDLIRHDSIDKEINDMTEEEYESYLDSCEEVYNAEKQKRFESKYNTHKE